jgi:bifunctional enzyme CysN/CysC
MHHLETVEVDEEHLRKQPFRLPVQWVNRPNPDFRGFAGTIAAGTVRVGDRVSVQPAGRQSTVVGIVTADGELEEAIANQSVTLTLADEVDISRGDVICAAQEPARTADRIEATVVWMSDPPMLRRRNYLLKIGAKTVIATLLTLKYKVNINTLEHVASDTLGVNEIGVAELELDRTIAFDPYAQNRDTGGFILIDRLTNNTVAMGLVRFAPRRESNVLWQALDVSKGARRVLNGHQSGVVWLTGLSGAGKSTIANLLEKRLYAMGKRTYLLDGDNLRHGLNRDLGFTAEERVENIRRVAEVAKLMADAGLIVITAFISPFHAERSAARELMEPGEFIEVFVDTPLEVAEQRDPKGLYRKARRGELKNFTGIDSPYEVPQNPDIRVDTTRVSPETAVEQIYDSLISRGFLDV